MFRVQMAPLIDAAEKFRAGLKQHEARVGRARGLDRALRRQKHMFGGGIEAGVLTLREQYKNILDKVAAPMLSHLRAQNKSKFVFAMLDEVKKSSSASWM